MQNLELRQVINGNEFCESLLFIVESHRGVFLGHCFFILDMNDIPKVIKPCKMSLYADDTCLYVSSKDPKQMHDMIMRI